MILQHRSRCTCFEAALVVHDNEGCMYMQMMGGSEWALLPTAVQEALWLQTLLCRLH